MSKVRIALAQIDSTIGDFSGNLARITERIDEARNGGADLVVFPELSLTGYPPGDLLRRQAFISANERALEELSESSAGITLIVGSIIPGRDIADDGTMRPGTMRPGTMRPGTMRPGTMRPGIAGSSTNASGLLDAAVILRDRETIGVQGRSALSRFSYFDEREYFSPDTPGRIFEVAGHQLGLTIGNEDLLTDGLVARMIEGGADLIINLTAIPFHRGILRECEELYRRVAVDHRIPLIVVNRAGSQDELVFSGGSLALDADGGLLARARPFSAELLIIELGAGGRAHASPTTDRDEWLADGDLHEGHSHQPEIIARVESPDDDLGEIYRALTTGVRGYARKNGFDHVLLGLSGGLDSALVATIAVDALGSDAVTAVWMPSRYSTELSRRDAEALAELQGIELLTIPIEDIFATTLDLLEPHFAGHEVDLTEENLQARIRGNLLMALSNKFGWLVLIASNKSEAAVGYTTLYGDMAGGLAPIKDLPKTLVFELARWRNRQGMVIPVSTIERPPTAELRADQLDTDSLPPYEVLDPILDHYLVEGWSAERIIAEGFDHEVVERIITLVDRAEYKRRQAAPGIKVSRYTFGVDDQMPLTSYFREL